MGNRDRKTSGALFLGPVPTFLFLATYLLVYSQLIVYLYLLRDECQWQVYMKVGT